MKLDPKALAITFALTWGGSVFVVALLHRFWGDYGTAFLNLAASIYPGYEVGGIKAGIIGTMYAAVDGAVFGWLTAWLYNKVVGGQAAAA